MANLNAELKLIHFRNAENFNLNISVEVAAVLGVANEFNHLLLQGVDVLESRVKSAENRNLLSHGLAPRDVLDPQVVKYDIGSLYDFAVVDTLEDRVQKGNMLYGELVRSNVDTVANVIGMLNKEEN